jgi:hypothetical protein
VSLAPFKHPSVFVGCPYTPAKIYKNLRAALDRLPIEFVFADSSIKTQHVVERVRRGITRTDYSLFDITGWNANVTLEVGLAEGLNKDYYILFHPGRGSRREPPADLKGLQRLEYRKLDGSTPNSLAFQITEHLVKKLTHPRNIFDHLAGPDREKMFTVAMRILAHFKKSKFLRREDLSGLTRGTYLRRNSVTEILRLLKDRGLLKGRIDGPRWAAGRDLYRHVKI